MRDPASEPLITLQVSPWAVQKFNVIPKDLSFALFLWLKHNSLVIEFTQEFLSFD